MQSRTKTKGGHRPPFAFCIPVNLFCFGFPAFLRTGHFFFQRAQVFKVTQVRPFVCWLIFSIALLFDGTFFFAAATFLSSSADHVALCDNTMRRSSLENSRTLKSSDSPISVFSLFSFARFLAAQKPSIPYGSSRIAPLSFLLMIVHLCTEPTVNMVSKVSHGFSSRCL